MRKIIYIGDKSCRSCKYYKKTVIDPLMEKYPDRFEVHTHWDSKIAEVNAREEITRVPTLVVENDGKEEFRFTAFLEAEQLEGIVLCETETSRLGDHIGLRKAAFFTP